ncbi:MAG: OmpA family protein [Sulfurimicrobium sp.]|nr:OmpA family protein [Sulfurimicrobium sp.]
MKRIAYILSSILALSFLTLGVSFAQSDVKGSKDHPLITRMPDYFISKYEVSEFAGFDPTVIGGKDVHWEGKVYSYGYSRKDGGRPITELQIVRNYEAAIKQVGGKILGGDERRVATEIRKDGALTGVYVEVFNVGRDYSLTIVESQAMRQEVVADASVMRNDLADTGRTIIHGIYFDTASATIKPESERALAEMVKLLNGSTALKVYVVGHTDSVGNLDSNLKLSSDRAASVVKAIAARGIAAPRLKSAGVGPYAPVASNDTDAGKAKNRRVELVKH